MKIPKELRYTKEHEWITMESDIATVGITDYAQRELGDVVFVEFPKVGDMVTQMKPFGTIETVKAVSELFAPVSGEVIEINTEIETAPQIVNQDPYGTGWMIKIRMSSPEQFDDLLSAEEYAKLIGEVID